MGFMQTTLPIPNRAVPWIVLAAGIVTLGGALAFQYIGGLEPCALCLTQRQPYWVAIPAAALAVFFSREANLGLWALIFLGICAAAFAVSGGIAFYHAGAEYGWWPGPASCSTGGGVAGSIEELRASLENAAIVPCDEAPWSLFGISLAGYNFLISLGLTALSLLPIVRFCRGSIGVESEAV